MFGDEARRLAAAAAALLGWSPDQYWRATPAELLAALTPGGEPGELPDKQIIDALMKRFPDAQG